MFQINMNHDELTIPNRIYIKRPDNYSCTDCPTPVLRIKYIGKQNYLQRTNSNSLITLTNNTSFTIKPHSYAKIHFNILVRTSLPAVSIIYDDNLLFRHGLTCIINQIPTNDTLLNVTIYNNKSELSTFAKESLQFICNTLLAHYT